MKKIKPPLTIAYPNFTKETIESATGQTNAFLNTTPERFELILRKFFPQLSQLSSTEKEIIEKAREMVKRISKIKPNIYSTILNPTSPEFPLLKDEVERYLSEEDIYIKTLVIKYLGLDTAENIAYGYRRAKELTQNNNENSAFYARLTNSIREHIEEIPSAMNVLTKDDLPSLIDAEISLDNVDIPTLEDLRKQSMPLSQKPLRPVYSIDPQSINWKNLVPPTWARFGFYNGGTRKFIVGLYYQNEDGESLYLPIWCDTRKGEFDWGFMEAPDDPEMKDMRDAALLATQSILTDVQRRIDAEHQERQREREARMQIQRPAQGRKVRSGEQYVPRQKEERQERPMPPTPIQEILEGQFILPVRKGVKRYISLPEEEGIRSMMEGFSEENQNRIIAGINRFNERGTGKFKPLEVIEHDGKPAWELRVGDFRALVTRADPTSEDASNKRDAFTIYKIDDRKNIFKKKS